MGILDNDTVIVDAILTKLGRQKLAQGQPLGVTQFAFGDTGVDYTLYNTDHPSGSSAYGSAITNLPMMEAVPETDVFLRFPLWGTGERNVEFLRTIQVQNSSETVNKNNAPNSTSSAIITIEPYLDPAGASTNVNFVFFISDCRGIIFPGQPGSFIFGETGFSKTSLPSFGYPNPVSVRIEGAPTLSLSAAAGQISSETNRDIQITKDGAIPTTCNVTLSQNNTANVA
jgi:hypothetical protein